MHVHVFGDVHSMFSEQGVLQIAIVHKIIVTTNVNIAFPFI